MRFKKWLTVKPMDAFVLRREEEKRGNKLKRGDCGKVLPQSGWANLLDVFCDCVQVTVEQIWV